MSKMVEAWNKETGEQVPYLVPEHHIGHKIWGPNLVSEPPKKRAATTKKEEA